MMRSFCLKNKNALLTFLAALLLTLASPVIFSGEPIAYFVPFLVICWYQYPQSLCAWYALACGVILDLIGTTPHLGITATAYTVTTLLLFPYKRYFFSDTLSTLPVLTFMFSAISGAIGMGLLLFFDHHLPISFPWIMTDIILLPCCDGLYAFLVFTVPGSLFGKRTRKGREYFL